MAELREAATGDRIRVTISDNLQEDVSAKIKAMDGLLRTKENCYKLRMLAKKKERLYELE